MDLYSRTLSVVFTLLSLATSAQLSLERIDGKPMARAAAVEDITSPRTDLLRTEARAFVYGPATRIKFKIIEEGSGLSTTYFKIADLPFMKSDGRQMVPHDLADGSYDIQYYSVDKAGNQEQVRTNKIYIDKLGPKISAGFNGSPTSFENGLPIFGNNFKLVIEIEDDQVDVQKVTYKINDGEVVIKRGIKLIDLTKEVSTLEDDLVKIEIQAYDLFYNLSKEVVEFRIKR